MSNPGPGKSAAQSAACALAAALAFIVAWGALYIERTSFPYDGARVHALWDDAMISMQYARNLRRGYGLVWNPDGERVQGFSNTGVTLCMAALHALPLRDIHTALAFQVLELLLLVWIVVWIARVVARRLEPDPWTGAATALATALCAPLAIWCLQGADVGFVTAWGVTAVGTLASTGPRRSRAAIALPWLLALGLVFRLDVAVLYVAATGVWALRSEEVGPRILRAACALLAVVCVLLAINWAYYGDPLPNTYYLKATGAPRRLVLERGLAQLLAWGPGALPALGLAIAGLAIGPRSLVREMCGAMILGALVYEVWVGGDWVARVGSRFVTPVLPLLLALAASGARRILARALPRAAPTFANPALVVLATVGAALLLDPGVARREWLDRDMSPLFKGYNAKNYRTAVYLRDFTYPDTTIAVHWAGVLPYFSDRPAIDVLGRSDRHIARLSVEEFAPGHSKADWDYVVNVRRPDVLDIPSRGLESRADFHARYYRVQTLGARPLTFYLRRDAIDKLTDPNVVLIDLETGEATPRQGAIEHSHGPTRR